MTKKNYKNFKYENGNSIELKSLISFDIRFILLIL